MMFTKLCALLRRKPVESASITGLTQAPIPPKKKIAIKKIATKKVVAKVTKPAFKKPATKKAAQKKK